VRARMADEFATESEVERSQQALLHGESSEVVRHLEQAYQHGGYSPGVKFMLARALQPRMSDPEESTLPPFWLTVGWWWLMPASGCGSLARTATRC
jgi:hypothetical protein